MKLLQRELNKLLGVRRAPPADRRSVTSSKLREAAAAAKCEIEAVNGGGFNVWPPKDLDESRDPYEGDHYANNAREAHAMIAAYAALR